MNKKKFTRYLNAFDFKRLFNELGWDHFNNSLPVAMGNEVFELAGVVEKKGFVVLYCPPESNGNVPLSRVRRQIEHVVTKTYFEHLIIYTDAARSRQVWQLALREQGKPRQVREVSYYSHQDCEGLFQRLKGLLFTLDEEESVTLVDVKARVMENFAKNSEKVTKKFYTEFKKHHTAFLQSVEGIDDALPDKENKNKQWYVSVMFSRLMFCYFIQKKGYLNQDVNYLQNKLRETREKAGENQFYNFYRTFLLELFHQGLGKPEDRRVVSVELGRIPYLNGGLFDVHVLELLFDDIQIRDAVFERVFNFFDQWNWLLDMRAEASGKDINPDVIGYIFEKYINDRAAMGAYYTKEDITEYIGKNCIIPFVFDAVRRRYAKPFKPDGEIWQMLKTSGDAYIYDAVKKGVELDLPENIAVGLDTSAPDLLERRKHWNTPAPEAYALPTEIWRETIERRSRYGEVRQKIENGEITEINDFITYNLNIRQFTADLIANTDDPKLIREFYKTVAGYTRPQNTNEKDRPPLSILDPTCGSGAFLFAALNILEPMYEGCIERMEQFAEESSKKDKCFEKVLKEVNAADHPSREYFICKSVILNNLYGVDIMKEAVEIARLRLFLRIVASVDMNPRKPNYGLEPLPDIDFNIRSGNTLVGFATETELMEAVRDREGMFAQEKLEEFKEECGLTSKAFVRFKDAQLIEDMNNESFKAAKQEVTKRLGALNDKLNTYLASVYNIDSEKQKRQYEKWLASHQPFHWFAEFYSIVADRGGFDVIIGNPPYVEYKTIRNKYTVKSYLTESCANLYAYCYEQSVNICNESGKIGLIIPVASVCTDRYSKLQKMWQSNGDVIISNYNDRPGKLFEGLEHIRLSIVLLHKKKCTEGMLYSTKYNKWNTEVRYCLFDCLSYEICNDFILNGLIPKIGSRVGSSILDKVIKEKKTLQHYLDPHSSSLLYYTRKLSGFVQVLDFIPSIFDESGNKREPSELKTLSFNGEKSRDAFLCILNSSLFFWLLTIGSDCRNLNKREVFGVKVNISKTNSQTIGLLSEFRKKLMNDFNHHSKEIEMYYKKWGKLKIQCIYPKYSKPIIDEIDKVLAQHYGFTEEELDFIINYDIKYRMGKELK
ncbi:Eco57I restriction-modification methylase domain-containing protein [Desulfonema magnum]|uniref:site-specific DNA-methyltransferase (adenine-specific) n=1 Tax=Desulfonema magnum TaxID=45655 RepID=A0A975BMR8_9BACT|nr:DNA methyltransferase [Desulfonema magnum]QTA88381.1 N-6 adenine-specific DNA methylase [Desulfonema magnum]